MAELYNFSVGTYKNMCAVSIQDALGWLET